jgi:tetratricopeptide (TPR) repeat protein
MRVMESWLIFQKGRLKEASAILREAEAALSDTDDYITRGNIQSAYGRIARREGHYERALEHFENAIAEYRKHDPNHRNLARSLVNRSFAKRLIALGLQEKLDREAAHRKAGGARAPGESRQRGDKARLENLRREAVEDLDSAYAIHAARHNHRGMGAVKINYGLLRLDGGELDRAAAEAAEAFALGEEKRDHILMARARILQCQVEEAKFEEQIEDAEDPGTHARRAHEYAGEALDLARLTQNRRLLARAYVWRGLTFTNEFVNSPDSARECCDSALALLRPEAAHDYTWKDLQELRSRILDKSRVDTALREWSQGLVGDKTLQQLTEEFAGIIIPRVWECEERKISRVAARLSVSPKKVRRILHARGLLGEAG